MKNLMKFFSCFIVSASLFTLLTGCGSQPLSQGEDQTSAQSFAQDGNPSDIPVAGSSGVSNASVDPSFMPSMGIDENGFWEGIRALDYVEVFDYRSVKIPEETHTVSDEALQSEIDSMLSSFPSQEHILDRAVEDGDIVNIDYVGSVDGVEFDGGSTGGMGAEVTAGSMDYIDDFLTQIIGHMPGETVNVEVTFPDDYGQEHINGKDAVFVTTINYIVGDSEPAVLNDDFVVNNLSQYYSWTTVDERKKGMRENLRNNAIQGFIYQYFTTEVTVKSVPDQLTDYQTQSMFSYYQSNADNSGMGLEEFVYNNTGLSTLDELVENNLQNINDTAVFYLVNQAIAEDVGLSVSEADLTAFFTKNTGSGDYSALEQQYGLPYLRQAALCDKVANYILDNAELER